MRGPPPQQANRPGNPAYVCNSSNNLRLQAAPSEAQNRGSDGGLAAAQQWDEKRWTTTTTNTQRWLGVEGRGGGVDLRVVAAVDRRGAESLGLVPDALWRESLWK